MIATKTIKTTKTILTALAAVAVLSTAALADPTGKYQVAGQGPDGSAYKGTATVEKTGDTYKVSWVIAGQKYLGTAVGNDDFFAVSYVSGSTFGVAVYGKDPTGWTGVWTYAGSTKVGAEKLTR